MATEKVLIFCVLLYILEEMVYNTRYIIFATINDRLPYERFFCPFLDSARKGRKEADSRGGFVQDAPS